MIVRADIYYPLLQECVKSQSLELNGNTVGECLKDLTLQFPGAGKCLFDYKGQLREEIFVYINKESVRKAFLSDQINETDRLIIALMIMGG